MSAIVYTPYSALKILFNTSKLCVIKCRTVVKENVHLNHVRLRNFLYSNKRLMLWYLNEI